LYTKTKYVALNDFLLTSEIDVAILQKVGPQIENMHSSYKIYNNSTYNRLGTAMLVKDGIPFNNVKYHPSGRIISGDIYEIIIINCYAYSGSNQRKHRYYLFASKVSPYLSGVDDNLILRGYFNSVLQKENKTPDLISVRP